MSDHSEFQEYRDMPEGSVILAPGRYEAEARWVPEFHSYAMDGMGEWVEDDCVAIPIDGEDVEHYPELSGFDHVLLTESDSGFIFAAPRHDQGILGAVGLD